MRCPRVLLVGLLILGNVAAVVVILWYVDRAADRLSVVAILLYGLYAGMRIGFWTANRIFVAGTAEMGANYDRSVAELSADCNRLVAEIETSYTQSVARIEAHAETRHQESAAHVVAAARRVSRN